MPRGARVVPRVQWAAVAWLVLAVAACSGSGTDEAQGDATNSVVATWVLEEIYQGPLEVDFIEGLSTTAIPGATSWVSCGEQGKFTGEGPCNAFEGSYSYDGARLLTRSGKIQAGACPLRPGGPDAGLVDRLERLIATPFISDTSLEVTVTVDQLRLATDSLALVFSRHLPG